MVLIALLGHIAPHCKQRMQFLKKLFSGFAPGGLTKVGTVPSFGFETFLDRKIVVKIPKQLFKISLLENFIIQIRHLKFKLGTRAKKKETYSNASKLFNSCFTMLKIYLS